MVQTKPSRWRSIWRYGFLFAFVLIPAIGGAYVYQEWGRYQEMEYASQCRAARDAGQWKDLQRVGERWTHWDRRNADAWLFRADAAQHQGDFESAATCLKSIPETAAKALPGLVSLSSLQFGPLNRPLDGVQTCERILKMEPRTTAAHHQLIEFYAMSLQRRQLEYHIKFAIKCSREPPSAYVYLVLIDTMRLAKAVELNERWLTQYPDSDIFQVARVLQLPEPVSGIKSAAGDDKYSLADALFQRFPKNLELLAYKIELCIKRGDVDGVRELLRELPIEADEDSRFWRAKGWLHLTRGELPKAKQALQHAIDIFPMDWTARTWLADVFRRDGDAVEAERLMEIVRSARAIREKITERKTVENVPNDLLQEIADFARRCGEMEVAEALERRLISK